MRHDDAAEDFRGPQTQILRILAREPVVAKDRVRTLLGQQDVHKLFVEPGFVGIVFQRLPVNLHGLVETQLAFQQSAQQNSGPEMARVQSQCLAVTGNRRRELALTVPGPGKDVSPLGGIGGS